jgi:hypothetical protein
MSWLSERLNRHRYGKAGYELPTDPNEALRQFDANKEVVLTNLATGYVPRKTMRLQRDLFRVILCR